jgi:hypothetical protein
LPTPGYCPDRYAEDLLPTFSALTSDEDREQKAQLREPGTYLVITNLSSFASLSEYGGVNISTSPRTSAPHTYSAQLHGGSSNLSVQPAAEESEDPNIIILKNFEEPLRRSPASPSARSAPAFAPTSSRPARVPETPSVHGSEASLSKLDLARSGGRDAHLLAHYRSNISQRVIKVGLEEVEEDVFEIQARTFPPVRIFFLVVCYPSMAVDFILALSCYDGHFCT